VDRVDRGSERSDKVAVRVLDQEAIQLVVESLAIVDPETKQLVYASAGQPAWLMDQDGEVKFLESLSIPLGIDPRVIFRSSSTVTLLPGDVALLAADGLSEACSPEHGLFGTDRVLAGLRQYLDGTAAELADSLYQDARKFSHDRLGDDLTTRS